MPAANDANHDGMLGPGCADARFWLAIRVIFVALEGGQQQLNDVDHDLWLEPGTKGGKRVCGEGARSGGTGRQFHTPCYTVEQRAADCQRLASTAAHFEFRI